MPIENRILDWSNRYPETPEEETDPQELIVAEVEFTELLGEVREEMEKVYPELKTEEI